ncbi:DMT family transporter [Microbacteriaceae bacterium 4G12]
MRARAVPAPALVVIAIFGVQFGNALAGSFLDQVGPLGAAALRLFFSATILAAVVRPRVRGWDARTWLGVGVLGLALAGMNSLIYLAIAEIPIGVAVTVELFGPLAIAAAGIRRLVDALWVVLAVVGIALLGLEAGGALSVVGLLLAAGAAAFWGLYIVASAHLGSRVRGVDGLSVAMLLALVVVLPFGSGSALGAVAADPWLLAVFAGVALLTSSIPYSLEFLALKSMPSRVFGVLSSLGPAVAALAGLLVLQQVLSLPQLAAIVLVTVASVGVIATSRTASEIAPAPAPAGSV